MKNKYFNISFRAAALFSLLVFSSFIIFSPRICAQGSSAKFDKKPNPGANRKRGLVTLDLIHQVLKEYYYDPKYHGIDLDVRFKAAADEIRTEDRAWQINRTIAQVLLDFNDSHTSYSPPDSLYRVQYGFSMMMLGNSCFVVDVTRGSDAEAKGIHMGDEIVEVNGLDPARDRLWVISYIIGRLDPQDNLTVKLRRADKSVLETTIASKFLSPDESKKRLKKLKDDEQLKPYTCEELSPELEACKLRSFAVEKDVIDKMMKEVGAHKKMILDLRGNGGGIIDTEEYLTGYFFDQDVKIGVEKTRDKTRDRIAKAHKGKSYQGDLMVLVDNKSASASEIFSRAIQIEKRGKVVGDQSAGAVMESYQIPLYPDDWHDDYPFYVSFMSVTIADMIMSDGGRLEGVGVRPDLQAIPNRVALANKLDPVLAYAAQLMGSAITPAKAGEMHFLIPKQVDEIEDEKAREKEKKKDGKEKP